MNERSARAMLGVSGSATTGQIKRAIGRARDELHPDHGGDPLAFRQLVAAHRRLLASSPTVDPSASGYFTEAQASVTRRTASFREARGQGPQTNRTHEQATPAQRRFGDVLAEKLAAA